MLDPGERLVQPEEVGVEFALQLPILAWRRRLLSAPFLSRIWRRRATSSASRCARASASGPGGSVDLYACYADRPNRAWKEHALNPLKCDVTSARPAGPPFRCHGNLYRPAQDCSRKYGGAVATNRVVELGPDRFREEVVCRLAPEPGGAYPHGFHTLNVLDRRCFVDGKRRVIDPTWILRGRVFGARTRERRKSLRHGNRTG